MKLTEAFTVGAPPIEITLRPGEEPIGWYRNPEPASDAIVIFTTQAFWLAEGRNVDRLDYADIVGYDAPKSKARTDTIGMRVRTRDGFRFVRVAGRSGPGGKFADVFMLWMVLRVLTGEHKPRFR